MKVIAETTQKHHMNEIMYTDPTEIKIFRGGCKILFDWYRPQI